MKVLAFDQSLTATGWCVLSGSDLNPDVESGVFRPKERVPKKKKGYVYDPHFESKRLTEIWDWMGSKVKDVSPDYVVCEQPAYGGSGRVFELGACFWLVKLSAFKCGLTCTDFAKQSHYKFTTGRGDYDKPQMVKHIQSIGWPGVTDDNEADAISLALTFSQSTIMLSPTNQFRFSKAQWESAPKIWERMVDCGVLQPEEVPVIKKEKKPRKGKS